MTRLRRALVFEGMIARLDRWALVGGLWLAASLAAAEPFQRLSPEKQVAAIGDPAGIPEHERKAFFDMTGFRAMRKPGPMDWLSVHKELGQTYQQFVDDPLLPRPDEERSRIYVQPIGEFPKSVDLQVMADYCGRFFGAEVVTLPPVAIGKLQVESRRNGYTGDLQLKTIDLIAELDRRKPKDAFAYVGVTMTDLYPGEGWNFVFGQANYRRSVGVFSFARYGNPDTEKSLVVDRAAKVMAHEIGHMYGLRHCVYFDCLLNGANSLEEMDRAPHALCPVCLRKLQRSCGFEILPRYARLKRFYDEHGFAEAGEFAGMRIRVLLEFEEP